MGNDGDDAPELYSRAHRVISSIPKLVKKTRAAAFRDARSAVADILDDIWEETADTSNHDYQLVQRVAEAIIAKERS